MLLLNEGENGQGEPVTVPEQSEIARQCRCNTILVYRVSRQYVEEGLERVLTRKERERPPVPAKATGEVEVKIIALCCSEPPAGYSRWMLRLLEERSKIMIGIELSDSTIGGVLKKTPLRPHQKECRCIASKENAAFAAHMEDVLEVYHRPYNGNRSVIIHG